MSDQVMERLRAQGEKRAAEVAALPDGGRPARYDLAKPRSLLVLVPTQAGQVTLCAAGGLGGGTLDRFTLLSFPT